MLKDPIRQFKKKIQSGRTCSELSCVSRERCDVRPSSIAGARKRKRYPGRGLTKIQKGGGGGIGFLRQHQRKSRLRDFSPTPKHSTVTMNAGAERERKRRKGKGLRIRHCRNKDSRAKVLDPGSENVLWYVVREKRERAF